MTALFDTVEKRLKQVTERGYKIAEVAWADLS